MKVETPPAQWHRDASVHDALNDQIICQAVEDQLARPTQAAQDGTTFRSQASRHQRFHQTRLRKRKAIVEVRENAKKMKTKRRDENTDAGTIGPMIDLLAPVGENSLSETRRAQNKSPKRFDREKFQWRESEQTFTCPAGCAVHDQPGAGSKGETNGRTRTDRRSTKKDVTDRLTNSAGEA